MQDAFAACGKTQVPTFEQPVELGRASIGLPRTYIYCKRNGPRDVFRRFSEQAQHDPGWSHVEIDASHNPHVTTPLELAGLLDKLVREPAPFGA